MTAASLILNSPYAAPTRHWTPDKGGALVDTVGRRPASYEIFDIRNNTRRSEPLERVNAILATGTGRTLVLEIKGEDSEQNRAKRAALAAWVDAVNAKGGFGIWCWDVAFQPAQMQDILSRHAG